MRKKTRKKSLPPSLLSKRSEGKQSGWETLGKRGSLSSSTSSLVKDFILMEAAATSSSTSANRGRSLKKKHSLHFGSLPPGKPNIYFWFFFSLDITRIESGRNSIETRCVFKWKIRLWGLDVWSMLPSHMKYYLSMRKNDGLWLLPLDWNTGCRHSNHSLFVATKFAFAAQLFHQNN